MTKSKKLIIYVISLLASILFALVGLNYLSTSGENEKLTARVLESDSEVLSQNYLDIYSVPNDLISFSTDGDSKDGLPFSRAFDRDFNTHWESQKDVYLNGEHVEVLMTLSQPALIDRVLYGCEPSIDRGYPVIANISAKVDGEFVDFGQINTSATTSMMEFKFEPVKAEAIKFEYVQTNTKHRYNATAREFVLLQPENQELEIFNNLFTDYNELTVNANLTKSKLVELKELVKSYINHQVLEERLNRVEQVLNETLKFDPRREMSTNPNAENVILQHGDVAGRARELSMVWLGTNRQSTGITVSPGHELNIYVSAEQTDKLPSVIFTQFWGHWGSWKSDVYQLKPGKNTFTAGNYVKDDLYTHFDAEAGVVAGGPVYIINPYTPEEQQGEVKVYFEGGTVFPVYRLGGDEKKYKHQLEEYTAFVENNRKTAINVTELVSNNFIMTVRATSANPVYKTKSPEQNLLNWDTYFKEVMEFDGVQFGVNDKYYDQRNQYLNCNIRLMQPTGAAYAYTEHVGIQPDWEGMCIYTETFGWGITHELGHMMDISERTVSECSNNMVSKYNETAMEKTATRGDFAQTLAALTPDEGRIESYFNVLTNPNDPNSKRLNYLIWWLIESYDIGFWAKLENLYRFEKITYNEGEQEMSSTEKQVYLSSLVLGIDLSYYFERWGYNLNPNEKIFNRETASQTFLNKMQEAEAQHKISKDKQPKLWYLDSKEYLVRKEGHTDCYNQNIKPTIDYVGKTAAGYNLKFSSSCDKQAAHLGFEILESGKVIGFTYDNAFIDTKTYENREPSYTVIAYDRNLNPSAPSQTQSLSTQQGVCKLNEQIYNSLSEAVSHAVDNDEIFLLKNSFDSEIVVGANITITLDESVTNDITISMVGSGDLISVLPGKTLKILGNQTKKIILDGGNYKHNGALIKVAGSLNLDYVTLQNNYSSGNGGGLRLVNENSPTQSLEARHTLIKDNQAVYGGGIYDNSGRITAEFYDCQIIGNTAQYGGGIVALSGTVTRFTNCQISENTATIYGGGYYGNSYNEFNCCNIFDNLAEKQGGGIYFSAKDNAGARILKINAETIISHNSSLEGSEIYLDAGNINLNKAIVSPSSVSSISEEENHSIYYSIYLNSGTITVNSKDGETLNISTLGGNIFVKEGATLEVNNQMFNTISNVCIALENLHDGAVYLTANNFTFSNDDLEKIVTLNGSTSLSQTANQIIAKISQISVKFMVNGKVYRQINVDQGDTITLDADCGIEDKYAKSWNDGTTDFAYGSDIKIDSEKTFVATIGNKFKVKLIHNAQSQEYFVIPNTEFTLPNNVFEDAHLLGWSDSQNEFSPYSTILVDSDKTFYSVVNKKLKVTFVVDDEEISSHYVDFDEYLSCPQVQAPKNSKFEYWQAEDGTTYTESEINVKSNLTLKAVFSEQKQPLNLALIIGIVAGAAAVIAVIVLAFVLKRNSTKKKLKQADKITK